MSKLQKIGSGIIVVLMIIFAFTDYYNLCLV